MKAFKPDKIGALTGSMYESQGKWSRKNWEDSLAAHHRDVEKLLQKLVVLGDWKTALSGKHGGVAKQLIPEIFMDSYTSVHFACMGLYKQAYVSLRAALETALRLVYFSRHPVEYKWWSEERTPFGSTHVWGEGYIYFSNLDEVRELESKSHVKLFEGVKRVYKKLSRYVHSGAPYFQTTPDRFSPSYKFEEFMKWAATFKEAQKYVTVLLILGFAEEFRGMPVNLQKKILKAIEDGSYKKGIRKTMRLRIKGRI